MLLAILCCAFISQGCTIGPRVAIARALRKHGLEKQMKMRHPETGREIIMIGMIHVEKPEFFEEIRQYLDSVKREGYVVFYEGIDRYDADSARLDTALRKFRRVVGIDLDLAYDYEEILSAGYTLQSLEDLGLTTDRDINGDMTYNQLITEYERRYGEIVLTDYDWQTGLAEKYKRRKSGKQEYSSYDMTNTIREDYIIEEAMNSSYEKIVLLYGLSHWHFLFQPFLDAGYEVVEGKPYPSYKPKEKEE